jgi:hypothetical protein
MSYLLPALLCVLAGVGRVIGECKALYVMVDGKLTMHHTARGRIEQLLALTLCVPEASERFWCCPCYI